VLGKLRGRLTYANVMATVAVFIALGGSSYAALSLSRNSVRSRHILNGQVKSADIGRNAVTSQKVKDSSLLASDFAPGQLPRGEKGDKGDEGQRGLQGEPGSDGAPGSARAYAVGGGIDCPGAPVIACPVARGKGAPYIFKVADGVYCVGFPNVNAAAADSVVVVSESSGGNSGHHSVRWRRQNSACISYEFEVETMNIGSMGARAAGGASDTVVASPPTPSSFIEFTIALL
jgi:hypothetical protein